jgi:hypothetical protein
MNSSFLAPGDELCSFQYAQVLGDSGKGDIEGCGQVADGGVTQRQAGQDSAAGSIGKRCKGGVETGL